MSYQAGRSCQTIDWRSHKATCRKTEDKTSVPVWYDKHRKCQDGSLHEGKLELITWACETEETGWGHCSADESDDLQRKFSTEYRGDESKFFKYWPQGFRWTCCGTEAGMNWGCDHHGTGSKPCTCDFCRWAFSDVDGCVELTLDRVINRMGKPLPLSIYKEDSASRHGLKLRRGPDKRSFHPAIGSLAAVGREITGLEI